MRLNPGLLLLFFLFLFFKLQWWEKDGLIESRESHTQGDSSPKGDKNNTMVICLCPFSSSTSF